MLVLCRPLRLPVSCWSSPRPQPTLPPRIPALAQPDLSRGQGHASLRVCSLVKRRGVPDGGFEGGYGRCQVRLCDPFRRAQPDGPISFIFSEILESGAIPASERNRVVRFLEGRGALSSFFSLPWLQTSSTPISTLIQQTSKSWRSRSRLTQSTNSTSRSLSTTSTPPSPSSKPSPPQNRR